ncbi:MAG: hypothetical protein QM831_19715 [Kofleriaceae bacterium]
MTMELSKQQQPSGSPDGPTADVDTDMEHDALRARKVSNASLLRFGTPGMQAAVSQATPQQAQASTRPTLNFLSSDARNLLRVAFGLRLSRAESHYNLALQELKFENLIKKKEELGTFSKLALSGLQKVIEAGISFALSEIAAPAAVVEMLAAEHIAVEAEPKILGIGVKTLESVLGLGVDKGKDALADAITEEKNNEKEIEKDQVTDYLSYVQSSSALMWQHMGEENLLASDAMLLAVFAAFDTQHHSIPIYKKQLQDQIDRYMASHAKDIGHRVETIYGHNGSEPDRHIRHETRVAYLVSAGKRQMIYVDKEYDMEQAMASVGRDVKPTEMYTRKDNAFGFGEQGLWYDPHQMHINDQGFKDYGGPMGAAAANPEPYSSAGHMLAPVEADLQETALAAHLQRWNKPPQTVIEGPPPFYLIAVSEK